MTNYSQSDPRWKSKKLGTSSVSIGGYGCAITAVANLAGVTPEEVNSKLVTYGGFRDGNLIVWSKAAELFELPYKSSTKDAAFFPTIAETDNFKAKGVPQHFFVLLEDGTIIDSLDGKHKSNPYRIVGYRNVGAKEDPVEKTKELRLAELESKVLDLRGEVLRYNQLSDQFEAEARDLQVRLNQAEQENELLREAQSAPVATSAMPAAEVAKEFPVVPFVKKLLSSKWGERKFWVMIISVAYFLINNMPHEAMATAFAWLGIEGYVDSKKVQK